MDIERQNKRLTLKAFFKALAASQLGVAIITILVLLADTSVFLTMFLMLVLPSALLFCLFYVLLIVFPVHLLVNRTKTNLPKFIGYFCTSVVVPLIMFYAYEVFTAEGNPVTISGYNLLVVILIGWCAVLPFGWVLFKTTGAIGSEQVES